MKTTTSSGKIQTKNDRISILLGPIEILLTPLGTTIFCIIGWAISAPLSNSLSGMAWCWAGFALLLFTFQIERPWLNLMPLPPLTTIQLAITLKWSVGGFLLLLSKGASQVPVWRDYIAEALPINGVTSLLITVVCLANYKIIRSRFAKPKNSTFLGHTSFKKLFASRNILVFCWLSGILAGLYILIGVLTGTLDRGAAGYLAWAGKIWRPDTLLSATIRLRDIFYILVPVVIWEWRKDIKIAVGLLLITLSPLFLTLMLGSRGILLFPIILMCAGLWVAGIKEKIARFLMVLLVSFSLVFVLLIGNSRDLFWETSQFDYASRVRVILENSKALLPTSESISLLGREIYASSDPYLFNETGINLPERKFKGLENIRHIWLPKALFPGKQSMLDGHLVAKEIQGDLTTGMHEGRHVHFPSITFGGDMYSRFRWSGVLIGGTCLGITIMIFSRLWYQFAYINNTLTCILLSLLPITFLQGPPIGTLSSTIWNWGYEMPKYIIIIILCSSIIDFTTTKLGKSK